MRSAKFATFLACMFMFQSLWNVAAAFCVHESDSTSTQSFHFGHHQPVLCQADLSNKSPKSQIEKGFVLGDDQSVTLEEKAQIDVLDHQDHLPSMSQFILAVNENLPSSQHIEKIYQNHFLWINAYQSPHLGKIPPPPELTPLLVG
ncbi:cation efflux protein, CzcI-like [Acinetobacter sp. DSM 11652]|uniref:cation efflux protein, CzcI-like n=1 Tax=Acinetobacter sp. DSM 11652 TaxID=346222 RepID=UPI0008D09250|nr:cation efflux protein, CzcI-like [Acinetobacter sp. DSM 11652]SEL46746.1 hypothetical protein SAMN05216500_102221 [Acinetobacter sp. DSM 11652]